MNSVNKFKNEVNENIRRLGELEELPALTMGSRALGNPPLG